MRVLVTGANGYLGRYLTRAMKEDNVITLGLTGCTVNTDLSASLPDLPGPFEKIVHAAGLAHTIPDNSRAAQRFHDVNVTGTSNLLKALESQSRMPEVIIFISSVAVYGIDSGTDIGEDSPLTGNTPYARSKIMAEQLILEWGNRNNVKVLILRLPLIVGADPPGNLGAIIKAIRKGYYFRIGEGGSRRSMVLAEDVAGLIRRGNDFRGIYNLTDGHHPSVRELDRAIAKKCGRRINVMPLSLVRITAKAGDLLPFIPVNSMKLNKLTSTLTFSDEKARRELGWTSRPVLEHLVI